MAIVYSCAVCSCSEECIKLVVLLRNYVTMMHGQQNIKKIKNTCTTLQLILKLSVAYRVRHNSATACLIGQCII
jgi:hypothetical protein